MSFSKTLFQEQRIEDSLRDDPDYYIPNELLFGGGSGGFWKWLTFHRFVQCGIDEDKLKWKTKI